MSNRCRFQWVETDEDDAHECFKVRDHDGMHVCTCDARLRPTTPAPARAENGGER